MGPCGDGSLCPSVASVSGCGGDGSLWACVAVLLCNHDSTGVFSGISARLGSGCGNISSKMLFTSSLSSGLLTAITNFRKHLVGKSFEAVATALPQVELEDRLPLRCGVIDPSVNSDDRTHHAFPKPFL